MRTKLSTRVWPQRLTVALAGLVLGGAIAIHAPAVAAAAAPTPNPGWPSCRANIALLLDRSSSVGMTKFGGDPANVGLVKSAATTFLGLYLMPGRKAELPADVRLAPAW